MTTAPGTENTITVKLNPEQLSTLLSALCGKLIETRNYERGLRVDEKPGVLDTCCEAHRARYDDRRESHLRMQEKLRHTEALLEMLEDVEQCLQGESAHCGEHAIEQFEGGASERRWLSSAERDEALQVVIEATQAAEKDIPAQYVRSRSLRVLVALWKHGWRPAVDSVTD